MAERPLRRIEIEGGQPTAKQAAALDRAAYIRAIYVNEYRRYSDNPEYGAEEMPAWDGGEDSHGRNHTSVWTKLVSFFLRKSIPPAPYIRLQFAEARGRKPVRPNMLMSDLAVAAWSRYAENIVEDLKAAFASQSLSMQTRLAILQDTTPNASAESLHVTVLNDEARVSATPLFRYCMATLAGLPYVAQQFRGAALDQYAFEHGYYDAAWGIETIPDELRQEAAQLCTGWQR